MEQKRGCNNLPCELLGPLVSCGGVERNIDLKAFRTLMCLENNFSFNLPNKVFKRSARSQQSMMSAGTPGSRS